MATSSGRSSPEHTTNAPSQQKTQRSNSSFLLPSFLFSPAMTSSAPLSDPSASSSAPRRTSFGNHPFGAGSGRFSALSAFGFVSSSNTHSAVSSSPPIESATLSTIHQSKTQPSDSASFNARPEQTSQSQSVSKPPPPVKRHVCYPDGMGGTMCLEIKDRSRRGSSYV